MTIDELIRVLTEAKTLGHLGSEPVYIWYDGDWTEISMVDLNDGRIDLNMDLKKIEELNELKRKKIIQEIIENLFNEKEKK
tara:strand:- start:228 stop:470 length:243 start_codon:yes stop_codon:yes gene_type:complete